MNDKAQGNGEYYKLNGYFYKGQWDQDCRLVFRTQRNHGWSFFVGKVKNGFGVEEWADGMRFEGLFFNGKKNGKGKFNFKDGSVYSGEYKVDNIEGKGRVIGKPQENIQSGFE